MQTCRQKDLWGIVSVEYFYLIGGRGVGALGLSKHVSNHIQGGFRFALHFSMWNRVKSFWFVDSPLKLYRFGLLLATEEISKVV